jgi:DNA-binding phage protein
LARVIGCISDATEKQLSFYWAAAASGGNPLTLLSQLNAGKDTSNRKIKMALTREYKQTVLARIKRDPKFAKALYAEAVNTLMEGETDEGLSMLRDLVHANITFKELSRQTGFGEKALHRMLSRHGNPTTRNLFAITKAICEDLGIKSSMMLAT